MVLKRTFIFEHQHDGVTSGRLSIFVYFQAELILGTRSVFETSIRKDRPCEYVYVYVSLSLSLSLSLYISIYIYIYIYLYTHVYIYIYTYIHIHSSNTNILYDYVMLYLISCYNIP